jgi:hypothetical protein
MLNGGWRRTTVSCRAQVAGPGMGFNAKPGGVAADVGAAWADFLNESSHVVPPVVPGSPGAQVAEVRRRLAWSRETWRGRASFDI